MELNILQRIVNFNSMLLLLLVILFFRGWFMGERAVSMGMIN
jgi:hypothetical protein